MRYAKLTDSTVDKVTLEEAISLLEWPKSLGKIGNAIVTLNRGQYGLYIKCSGKNYSIKDTVDPNNINLKFAEDLIQAGDPYALKTFKVKDKVKSFRQDDKTGIWGITFEYTYKLKGESKVTEEITVLVKGKMVAK